MEKHKIIWEMYWVLLSIKEDYNKFDNDYKDSISFDTFAQSRIKTLFSQAFDCLVEDERENNNKIAQ